MLRAFLCHSTPQTINPARGGVIMGQGSGVRGQGSGGDGVHQILLNFPAHPSRQQGFRVRFNPTVS